MRRLLLILALAAPAAARAQALLRYTLRVDPADPTSFHVEMQIPASADTVRLAMATHDEVDDRFWRNIRDLSAASNGAPVAITREDSAVWRLAPSAGDVTVRYRIALPPDTAGAPREAWVPFMTRDGALAGGIDCFLYVVGRTAVPAIVSVDVPRDWRIATGLERALLANSYAAPDAAALLDSPFLLGRIREWKIPGAHVAYLPAANAAPFDSSKFLGVVQRIAEQAAAIFNGAVPAKSYTFMFVDGRAGTLEHLNSLVLGVRSAEIAKDSAAYAAEIAHEYFHTWNLIRLHPAGLRQVRTGPPPTVAELWWSEGITVFFADEILLRAGLYPAGDTRATRLAARIGRWLANPGLAHVSVERASLTAALPPGATGDYRGDYYLGGQMLGDILELTLRDSTKGARGMDQVMAALWLRAANGPGYTSADLERVASDVCGCDLRPFFARWVHNAAPLDFDAALRGAGWRMDVAWLTAKDSTGRPLPDRRVYVMRGEGAPAGAPMRLGILQPTGAWAAAGLHSGDEILSLDGAPVTSPAQFRQMLAALEVGQHVKVAYARGGKRAVADVMMDVYVLPKVTLVDLPAATPQQLELRRQWLAGR